jgi:hypothetical protein
MPCFPAESASSAIPSENRTDIRPPAGTQHYAREVTPEDDRGYLDPVTVTQLFGISPGFFGDFEIMKFRYVLRCETEVHVAEHRLHQCNSFFFFRLGLHDHIGKLSIDAVSLYSLACISQFPFSLRGMRSRRLRQIDINMSPRARRNHRFDRAMISCSLVRIAIRPNK